MIFEIHRNQYDELFFTTSQSVDLTYDFQNVVKNYTNSNGKYLYHNVWELSFSHVNHAYQGLIEYDY